MLKKYQVNSLDVDAQGILNGLGCLAANEDSAVKFSTLNKEFQALGNKAYTAKFLVRETQEAIYRFTRELSVENALSVCWKLIEGRKPKSLIYLNPKIIADYQVFIASGVRPFSQ